LPDFSIPIWEMWDQTARADNVDGALITGGAVSMDVSSAG
jgi:hypothetical protein